MNMKQCANGIHYYDADIYSECPYCKGSGNQKNNGGDSVTVSANGLGGGKTDSFSQTNGNQYTFVMDQGEDCQTMAFATNSFAKREVMTGDRPTVPLNSAQQNLGYDKMEPTEDDRTIGFFHGVNMSAAQPSAKVVQGNSVQGRRNVISTERPLAGWLVCIEGPACGDCYAISYGKNFIGRYPDMDICLSEDLSVSRSRHAVITYEPRERKFYAHPGDSHELFYLNDMVVLQTILLHDHDILSVGKSKLVFVPLCNDQFSWEK